MGKSEMKKGKGEMIRKYKGSKGRDAVTPQTIEYIYNSIAFPVIVYIYQIMYFYLNYMEHSIFRQNGQLDE